jgi:hypothetical protein
MKSTPAISFSLLFALYAPFAVAQAKAPVAFHQLAGLTPSDGFSEEAFGYSVAMSGNTIVAGAPAYGTGQVGKAYVYVKPASGWANATETAELTASDGVSGLAFGDSVAISGNTIVVNGRGEAVIVLSPSVPNDRSDGARKAAAGLRKCESQPLRIQTLCHTRVQGKALRTFLC